MRHDKLAHWVDDLRLPLWLAFVGCIAVSLVRLQRHNFQFLYPFTMEGFGMNADFPI